MMCVASEIKSFLKKNGIKQSYVADRAGIKRDAFCTVLSGKRKLPLDEYCRICGALDVPFEFFLNQINVEEGETKKSKSSMMKGAELMGEETRAHTQNAQAGA